VRLDLRKRKRFKVWLSGTPDRRERHEVSFKKAPLTTGGLGSGEGGDEPAAS